MGLDESIINPNVSTILNIERLFYMEEYEKAWDILSK
jgi:hypothetical protein